MNVFVELTEAYDRKPIKIKEIIIKTLVSMRTFWCFGHGVKNTTDFSFKQMSNCFHSCWETSVCRLQVTQMKVIEIKMWTKQHFLHRHYIGKDT